MTRRDTIISATLVNAGLLVILFVCALGIDEPNDRATSQASFTPSIHAVAEALNSAQSQVNPEPPQAFDNSEARDNQGLPLVESFPLDTIEQPGLPASVTVKKGDRLETIAKQHHTTVEELVELNKLASTQLIVGQTLDLPTPIEKPSFASSPKAEPKKSTLKVEPKAPKSNGAGEEGAQYHYVQRGESPWVIAKKYGLSVDKLLKINHLDEATARRLREGDRLRVR